jgi:UDP-N-acetylglucosamine acyltransferase
MGAIIGHAPQDVTFTGEPSFTRLGSRNIIREYVTIHRGTKPGTDTVVGDETFLMANAHLGHNCRIGSRVTLVNAATLAGYCEVEDGALISGLVVVHQFVRIGRLAMVSGLSAVNKDVPPFLFCGGRPAVIQGLNVVGLRRAGIQASVRQEIKQAYTRLYREGLNVPHALELIEQVCRSEEAGQMVAFIRASTRGICAGLGQEPQTLGPRKGMLEAGAPALLQTGDGEGHT